MPIYQESYLQDIIKRSMRELPYSPKPLLIWLQKDLKQRCNPELPTWQAEADVSLVNLANIDRCVSSRAVSCFVQARHVSYQSDIDVLNMEKSMITELFRRGGHMLEVRLFSP